MLCSLYSHVSIADLPLPLSSISMASLANSAPCCCKAGTDWCRIAGTMLPDVTLQSLTLK